VTLLNKNNIYILPFGNNFMETKQWGRNVWEKKIKTQGAVGVVGGTNVSTSKLKRSAGIFNLSR